MPEAATQPNVAEWMQAWTSLAAAAVTSLIAIILTGRLLRHEVRARREEMEDAQAVQARLIVLERKVVQFSEETALVCTLHNNSPGPVHNVVVHAPAWLGGGIDRKVRLNTVAPGGRAECEILLDGDIVQRAGDEILRDISGSVMVTFADAADLPWKIVDYLPRRDRARRPPGLGSMTWELIVGSGLAIYIRVLFHSIRQKVYAVIRRRLIGLVKLRCVGR